MNLESSRRERERERERRVMGWRRLGLVWLKKWSLSFYCTLFIIQTLFFHSLKIKHVWFHFLFHVTQNFAIIMGPIYCTGSDGTRVSSLSSSFSFFLSSLLCLYSPLRPKNFAPPLFHSLNPPLLSPTFLKSKGTKK